ncbi:hypothetical protein NMY3_01779 [Candidatus Nitrosocosmicus oleophilus]|jgi:hypothetical protein|uniref:Uncharacterized protein n=1 Tax=Candidatus Nitrosocosmicus oleophilus TaxID=1353260 RepID=A0A654M8Z8_9ARCH|nr:hypothetical protein NMY3_01779 [Candidatus Nitrosocosmicus oleophilus]
MSTSFEFGCVHCGSNIQTRTPDVVHIEANRKIRTVGNWFDWYNNVRMNVKCSKCNRDNRLYWYKPARYFQNWNRY